MLTSLNVNVRNKTNYKLRLITSFGLSGVVNIAQKLTGERQAGVAEALGLLASVSEAQAQSRLNSTLFR